jgi:hypothetical protein
MNWIKESNSSIRSEDGKCRLIITKPTQILIWLTDGSTMPDANSIETAKIKYEESLSCKSN